MRVCLLSILPCQEHFYPQDPFLNQKTWWEPQWDTFPSRMCLEGERCRCNYLSSFELWPMVCLASQKPGRKAIEKFITKKSVYRSLDGQHIGRYLCYIWMINKEWPQQKWFSIIKWIAWSVQGMPVSSCHCLLGSSDALTATHQDCMAMTTTECSICQL